MFKEVKNNKIINKRNITADFVKGILIFCVIFGHSISMINSIRNVTWADSAFNIFITTFEMPLFILISGYFLFFSLNRKSYKTVLIKRVISIAVPIAFWEGIPACYTFINTTINNGFSFIELLRIAYKCAFPGLWFLAAYLICSIIVIIVEWTASSIKDQHKCNIIKMVFYLIILIAMNFIDYYISNVQFLFIFFLLGFFIAKHDLLNKPQAKIIMVVCSILYILLYPLYKPENSFYLLGSYLNPARITELLPIFLHRFVLSFCGCVAVYFVCNLICTKKTDSKIVSLVSNLGTKTIELYIISMSLQRQLVKLFALFINQEYITDITAPLIWGPIFFIILVFICLLLIHIINKSKFLNKLLFGK